MTTYASVAQLRRYLTQVGTGADVSTILTDCLNEATSIIDGELGYSYSAYGAAAAKDVYLEVPSRYLRLPAHEIASTSTVSAVYLVTDKGASSEGTTELTDWEELEDGRLWYGAGWPGDSWYRVTAKWGYGAAPAALAHVCIEIAINLWSSRDARQISDVVGAEGGGAVGYNRSLTNRQRMVIDQCRRRSGEFGIA